jgi:hypothetical protein
MSCSNSLSKRCANFVSFHHFMEARLVDLFVKNVFLKKLVRDMLPNLKL